jgi:hypothetical protein
MPNNKAIMLACMVACIVPVVFVQFIVMRRTDSAIQVELRTGIDSTATAAAVFNVTPSISPATAAATYNITPVISPATAASSHNITSVINLLKESSFSTTVHIVFTARTFFETACGIRDAFVRAGLNEPTLTAVARTRLETFRDATQLHVLLGAHDFNTMPKSYIIYNLEQLNSQWMTRRYYTDMKNALAVAHFSQNGTAVLQQKLAAVPVIYFPIYVPFNSSSRSCSESSLSMAVVPSNGSVDVGFYGSHHDRRLHIMKQLQSAGMTTDFRTGFDLW